MSEPLFRFQLIRPPIDPNPDAPPIALAQDTPFQKDLAAAAKSSAPRSALSNVARAFITGNSFIGTPDATPFQVKLVALGASLDKLEPSGTLFLKKVVTAVKNVFQEDVGKVVAKDEFQTTLKGLKDSVVAIKFIQDEHARPLETLVKQIRDLELMQKAASLSQPKTLTAQGEGGPSRHTFDNKTPPAPTPPPPKDDGPDLLPYRKRSLQIPVEADLRSVIAQPKYGEGESPDPRRDAEQREEAAQEVIQQHGRLLQAINELVGVDSNQLRAPAAIPHNGVPVDKELSPFKLAERQVTFRSTLRDINVDQFKASAERGGGGQSDPLKLQDAGGSASALALSRDLLSVPSGLTPKGPWKPQVPAEFAMRLKEDVALSATTRAVLQEKMIDIQKTPLDAIVRTLREEVTKAVDSLTLLATDLETVSIRSVRGSFVSIRTPIPSLASSLLFGHNFGIINHALPALPNLGRIPTTKGKASIAGVGDLLVVRQQLRGYERADIAHVENVLKGETKQREHRVTTRTESTTVNETEVQTTDEHELASTTRFEMSQETVNTIKEDQSLKAGLQVSASYGPFVQVSASVEGATSRSKEETNKAASKFSQDVTERTVKKITERILQRQTLTTIKEVEEKNTHGINNAPGTGNISGVYQWINKLYEAQVWNYGLRTMFEFMVPEPATFIIEAMAHAGDKSHMLEKPTPFTQTPSDITRDNYTRLVLRYQATDVVPPPEDFSFKTDQVSKGGGKSDTDYDYGAVITVDQGYQATYATISQLSNIWEDDAALDVYVGTRSHRFLDKDGEWHWGAPLNNEIGSISWGFITYHHSNLVVSVEIKCVVTQHAIDAWKAETHAKLLTAYKARMQEYEEKLSALELQIGAQIEGKNPATNLITIKEELKKNCISILTAQHYDLFNSISVSATNGLPQIDLDEAEAEGSYVRFFEQAFEWEQIMYITYPYFWGQKNKWPLRLSFDDPDPVFNEFLRAGFCRVVIPARPGFEGAIDHFLEFGELWNGGPLPPISSQLFLPIADEIAERARRPGQEVPQGDPWTVRLPTELVMLRGDNLLPKWKKVGDEWIPDE